MASEDNIPPAKRPNRKNETRASFFESVPTVVGQTIDWIDSLRDQNTNQHSAGVK
jgi:hypothetical protein